MHRNGKFLTLGENNYVKFAQIAPISTRPHALDVRCMICSEFFSTDRSFQYFNTTTQPGAVPIRNIAYKDYINQCLPYFKT